MIWYFLAGFISGVVGTLMLGRHISRKMEEQNGIYRQGEDR